MKLPDLSEDELLLGFLCATAVAKFAALWHLHRRRPEGLELVGHVSGLFIHPVKSCARVSLEEALVTDQGIKPVDHDLHDRHLMVARPEGRMLTGRNCPKMLLIQPRLHDGHYVTLSAPGVESLTYDVNTYTGKTLTCKIWGEDVEAVDCGDAAASWLTSHLGENLRLVHAASRLPKQHLARCADPWYSFTRPHDQKAFQDFAPTMVATESSLEDLNSRLAENVSLRNFRPNISISGSKAWDEGRDLIDIMPRLVLLFRDEWQTVYIGDAVKFKSFKPCDRCVFTTMDPDKGEKSADGEPLKTLKLFRIMPEVDKNSPIFGMNLLTDFQGKIRVGDPIYILRGRLPTPA